MNLVELAQRVRAARLERGLTLEEVAKASGLGKGLLSKVENFRVTPTLPTLARLCETLGVKMSDLLADLDKRPELLLVRREKRMRVLRDTENSNIIYHSLAYGRSARSMDPFELTVPARGGRARAMSHEGEEFLIVLQGEVQFEFAGKVERLRKGDSIYFDAGTNHRVFNTTAKEARVLCVFFARNY